MLDAKVRDNYRKMRDKHITIENIEIVPHHFISPQLKSIPFCARNVWSSATVWSLAVIHSLEPWVHTFVPNFDIGIPPKMVSIQIGEVFFFRIQPQWSMMFVSLL